MLTRPNYFLHQIKTNHTFINYSLIYVYLSRKSDEAAINENCFMQIYLFRCFLVTTTQNVCIFIFIADIGMIRGWSE